MVDLAATGYDGQQTDTPARPNRPDNLWHPLPGDHGAHGRFDQRSLRSSPQTWINQRLPVIAMIACAAALIWRGQRWHSEASRRA